MRTAPRPITFLTVLSVLLASLLAISVAAPAVDAQVDDPVDGGAEPDAPAEAEEGPPPADIRIQTSEQPLDGVEVAVRLSRQADPGTEGVARVVLASSGSFADALASAVLQDRGPLLLVPPTLPLPPQVHAELVRLRPQEVVLLGGPAAISEAVEQELQRLRFRTVRVWGPSRVDTAAAVAAQEAPEAVTAILVRAYDATGGDGSAAWADSVTAGAMATQLQLPILLTESGRLSDATAAHLRTSGIRTVIIVGGTAAVSPAVERTLRDQGHIVSRIAGPTRHETALAVAEARRLPLGTSRAILLDVAAEHGWQAGLAAARHAWQDQAPILTVAGDVVPDVVQAALAQVRPPAVTCVVGPSTCAEARRVAGLPDLPDVVYSPPAGSAIAAGEHVVVGADDPHRLLRGEAQVSSSCTTSHVEYLPEGSASFWLAPQNSEEHGGDFPEESGPTPIQPHPGAGEATGAATGPTTVGVPLEINEPAPVETPLTTCLVTTTFQRTDGGELVDIAPFEVVDLRPRIRVTTTVQVEDREVTFQDRSDGLIDQWAWDFGDGTSPTPANALQDPSHTYREAGCYDVSLTITSPLEHWRTGRQFTDTEVRTVAIDPSSSARGALEVLVIDAATDLIAPFEPVSLIGPSGAVVQTGHSDGSGWVDFGSVAPGTYTVQAVNTPKDRFPQVVQGGQTLCPALRVGPTGHLLVDVQDPLGLPVIGADVAILDEDGVLAAAGSTGVLGDFLALELAVGSYDVVVAADGYPITTVPASVEEDVTTEVPVRLALAEPAAPAG